MTPESFRRLHAANPLKCADSCQGWVISLADSGRLRIERCDQCWSAYGSIVERASDAAARKLPEAQTALKRAQAARRLYQ